MLQKTITVFTSIILALLLSECLLRVMGFRPWRYIPADANEPTMHAPDPVLGWRNKAGSYVVPPYHPSGSPIHMTFQEDGRRLSSAVPAAAGEEIVIIGGSYSQGWAVSDSETYAWKLQQELPSLKVVNYGTGGYGSYQSLLVLKRELPRMTSPKFVLYGFMDHHEVRNVAPASWLRILSVFSKRGHVDVPFATVDEDHGIVGHPPQGYTALPFRESSAVVALIEQAFMKIKTRNRFEQRRIVTEAIVLEMDRVSKKYGSTLFVVFLNSADQTKRHYMEFLKRNNIQYIDCAHRLTKDMVVPGEEHPNGKMHSLWAQEISSVLADRLKPTASSHQPTQPTP